VPQLNHGVVPVLTHCSTHPQPCPVLAYCLPGADVLVHQYPWVAHANKQPVVRQELKLGRFDVIGKSVELNTVQVVHVCMLRLSYNVQGLVLQESETE